MSRTVYYDWQGHEIDPPHDEPVPMTNADRIRAQTDEELAKLMEDCGCCPPGACPHEEKGAKITRQDCEMCWLEWLKSPAEERT